MPSYRLLLQIGTMRDGASPAEVIPTAVAAAGRRAYVGASDVAVRAGVASVQLRLEVEGSSRDEEDATARACLADVIDAVEPLAQTGGSQLLLRTHGRWLPVPAQRLDPETGELT